MDGLELMATAMRAMQARVDIAAGNLANVSSDGFRRSVARVALGARGLRTTAVADAAPGVLRRTGRGLDLSVAGGTGGMLVRDATGRVAVVRSASFARDARGVWCDERGRELLSDRGALRASADAHVDERGVVTDGGEVVGTLRMRAATALESGVVEASNVDAVKDMVDLLAAQRGFETAAKALSALDEVRAHATSEIARVKQ
jgi:flagellar basal body rod protein FlgG